MILYTMMPEELVFPTDINVYDKQKVVQMNGVSVVVSENAQKQYEVVRLLSTDPQDFLKEQYCPGQTFPISF
ncbi:MAG TPA: YlzJ-like family protein [Bacillus sp. (in: firmicutes)]|nr:YlzJ-like family protein [Bacillus sp. (in: firmicutes)]